MPQFSEFNRMSQVSYITGPSHVLLAIDFVTEPVEAIEIIKRPAIGDCEHGLIYESELKNTVLKVISDLNRQSQKFLYPAKIAYVADDSPRLELYAICTKLLYEKFLQKITDEACDY